MSDAIEKTVELNVPPERVWRAISDAQEFGQWFGVAMEGTFEAGRSSHGRITKPAGYEHLTLTIEVVRIEPPALFAFTWHPYAVDPAVDYDAEAPTLVEFRLEPSGGGTRLTVRESGFDKLPAHRRDEAWRMNDSGWSTQLANIGAHVGG